jgi:hypothetical protein
MSHDAQQTTDLVFSKRGAVMGLVAYVVLTVLVFLVIK